MSFCARTSCEIYRDKRFCRTANEKERDGVCDCRHARYICETGKLCMSATHCAAAPDAAKEVYRLVEIRILLERKEKK